MSGTLCFRDVSKFYGEVLGVSRISLEIGPGLTGLVGPNGAGKSTLMHLAAGLLRPSDGDVSVLGVRPDEPERLHRVLGYCTQYDSFPAGVSGRTFLIEAAGLHGMEAAPARHRADEILATVGLAPDAAGRRVAAYSKGMRQRLKLGHALLHDPPVLLLDEPLDGLDPVGREAMARRFRQWADAGRVVVVSSHILEEIEEIADSVVMIDAGAVVAEGGIRAVRSEITGQPVQVLIRCRDPRQIAAHLVALEHVVELRILGERDGLVVRTVDADSFFRQMNRVVIASATVPETVLATDEDVASVYEYLIGGGR